MIFGRITEYKSLFQRRRANFIFGISRNYTIKGRQITELYTNEGDQVKETAVA
jgi:hypothetical protein